MDPIDPRPRASLPLAMFVNTWLPYSETFIYDQILHQQVFTTTVYAARLGEHASRFPHAHVVVPGPVERVLYAALHRSPTITANLRRSGARVIHAHFGTNGVFATPFARSLDLPLAVTFHGHDVSGLLPGNRWTLRYGRYHMLARQMFDVASLLLCASEELATMLLEFGAPEAKIRVHRLGIDLDRWSVPTRHEGPLSVLMIGRFVEKKGMSYGIAAFADVWREHPDIRLRIVGEGPLASELRRQVAELGLGDAVTFVGILGSEEVRGELERAHVLIAPSVVARDGDRESGVIVLKEAGACGLPTIGTLHGGIPEIIEHERTGFLVPERDVKSIAGHLRDLISDGELRLRLGLAARAAMEERYDTRRQNRVLERHLLGMLG